MSETQTFKNKIRELEIRELNKLLNSPIIPKKIPEFQPSPLILGSNKDLSEEFLLENENNEKLDISFEKDSDLNDEELNNNREENKPEIKKLCVLEMLKKVSKEKHNIRKLQ